MRILSVLIGAAALLAAAPPQLSPLIGLAREDQRIAAIAYRLQTANADLCRNVAQLSGFVIHDLNQYAPAWRNEAAHVFGLNDKPVVLAVAPGSPAARAGLKAGDVLTAVEGSSLAFRPLRKARMDSVLAAQARIDAAMADGTLRLSRAGQADIAFRPASGCAVKIEQVPGGKLNASADDRTVRVYSALVEFAGNDDAVATAVAHEMAHTILAHQAALDARGRKARIVRATEEEADYWGMYLLVRAGFDGDAAIDFWQRYEARTNAGIFADGTHPGRKARVAAARATLAEIQGKLRVGQPLIPQSVQPAESR